MVRTVSPESALAQAARLIAETEEPGKTLQGLLDLILEEVGASAGSVMSAEGDRLVPVATEGIQRLPTTRPGQPNAGRSSIPLTVAGRVEGMLILEGAEAEQVAQEPSLRPLLALTALALHNSRLARDYAELGHVAEVGRARRETFQALYDVAVATRQVLDPLEFARLVVDQARQLVSGDYAALYWWNNETGALRRLAHTDPAMGDVIQVAGRLDGTIGSAFQTAEPVIVNDYAQWPGAFPAAVERGVQSVVAIPLLVRDRPTGVLTAGSNTRREFGTREVERLTLMGGEVAPALETTRLYVEGERHIVELQALAELMRYGATEPDPERTIARAAQQACTLLGADYSAVALFEPDGTLTWHGVHGNRSDIWHERRVPSQGGAIWRALDQGRTVLVERVGDNLDFPAESMPVHLAEGGRTVLAVPLVGQEGRIGALLAGWRKDMSPEEDQIRLAEGMARYAAMAIENVRSRAAITRQAEELGEMLDSLQASEGRLRTLYEAIACGVLVRNATGEITHANAMAEETFGFSSADMQGHTPFRPLWPLSDEAGRELPPEQHPSTIALRTGQPVHNVTVSVLRPDGERRWLLVHSVPVIGPDGQPEQVVSSFIDVTGRKEVENQVRKLNEELEERVAERTADLAASYRELESFSYSVSHDLRAPLRGIDGFSQALLEDYGDQLDATGQGYLQRVRTAAQYLAQLIDDLLELSRVVRTDMRRDAVNLSQVAQSITDDLQATEPDRPVRFDIEDGLLVQADSHLVRVLLFNLIENAWKFTSKHPTAHIEFGAAERDGQRAFYVRDDGAGLDMAYADKLFRPFQRLHGRTEFEGTGIGLASVQRIIQRHGGRVWAEGAVEKGATFYFTL